MVLSRKDIMLLTNKEEAFEHISMHTDWTNHRKAAERSSWKKKHEPENIARCPNRGKRYKKKEKPLPPPPIPKEEDDPPCCVCDRPSDGYDFPCSHPICHTCFREMFLQSEGKMTCPICKKEFLFHDNLVDDEE